MRTDARKSKFPMQQSMKPAFTPSFKLEQSSSPKIQRIDLNTHKLLRFAHNLQSLLH